MAEISITGRPFFKINGQSRPAPVEWEDIQILATFNDEAVQASVNSDSFTFVNNNAQLIKDWIDNGLNGGLGIFEGPDFMYGVRNRNGESVLFDGFLNLAENYLQDLVNSRVFANIKENDIGDLTEKIESLTYGYLEYIGVFSNSDYIEIDYVVEKKFNALEVLMTSVILYLMIKEFAEAVKETQRAISSAVAYLSAGITGSVAAAIFAVAEALIITAYTAIMLLQIIDLGNSLINTFIPPKRKAKVISYYNLLKNVINHLGYEFSSTIADLHRGHYLPSNNRLDSVDKKGFIDFPKGPDKAIPRADDLGYNCLEMFKILQSKFRAKMAIEGNVVHFENIDSDFWIKRSDYVMPNILPPRFKYNTQDLKANKLFRFSTDIKDDWTIDDSTGTYLEVTTDAISVGNERKKQIKGYQETSWNLALGARKSKLNALEVLISEVAGVIDEVADLFGKNPGLKKRVKSKVGMLKVSDNNYTKPKTLYLDSSGKIPINHRSIWGALYFYTTYHYGDSFVLRDYVGQKVYYEEEEIPLGYEDYKKLIKNSYFRTFDGREGKFVDLKWSPSKQKAIASWWIREPYTRNLKETTREL